MERAEGVVQVDKFTEGTHHQLALGGQAKRKHIFSSLDSVYAAAVHEDAETVEYTPEEEVGAVILFLYQSLTGHLSR